VTFGPFCPTLDSVAVCSSVPHAPCLQPLLFIPSSPSRPAILHLPTRCPQTFSLSRPYFICSPASYLQSPELPSPLRHLFPSCLITQVFKTCHCHQLFVGLSLLVLRIFLYACNLSFVTCCLDPPLSHPCCQHGDSLILLMFDFSFVGGSRCVPQVPPHFIQVPRPARGNYHCRQRPLHTPHTLTNVAIVVVNSHD